MFRWFFYEDSVEESLPNDVTRGDRRVGGGDTNEAENRGQGVGAEDDSDSETGVIPLSDDLDPTVAAAILMQVSCPCGPAASEQGRRQSASLVRGAVELVHNCCLAAVVTW